MDSPFVFSKEVTGEAFVGQKDELAWLASNFVNSHNSVIIAAPRFGKTSLIRNAILQAEKQSLNLKHCFLDLFNVREEADFYLRFTQTVLSCVSGIETEWEENLQQFLPLLEAKVVIKDPQKNELKLEVAPQKLLEFSDQILFLPEELSKSKGIKILVIVEHFDIIEDFSNTTAFQRKILRAWRAQENVAYLLCGGNKNAMVNLCDKPKAMFVKFGDVLRLTPPDEKLLVDYIIRSFSKSGRVIQKEFAEKICRITRSHPYYTQQLSHLVWHNTKGFVVDMLVENTIVDLLNHNHFWCKRETDHLSFSQIQYLKAVVDGVDRFCSAESIQNYQLNSSANVARARGALEKKEILEFHRHKPNFIDPIFELWFKMRYLAN